MTIKIFTHDRIFHADDAMAAAILRMAHTDVEVIRTRDPAILRAEMGQPNSFFIDVGGQYDPARRLFDHHQTAGAGYRNTAAREWPYASAGLVWKTYGADAVRKLHPTLDADGVAEVVAHIDDTILKYIDAVDCGVKVRTAGPSLSALIASFNNSWYEPATTDTFPLVMELAQVLLSNFIKRHAGKVLARDLVRSAPVELDGRVLILDACFPWTTIVAEEMPIVQFVAYPLNNNGGDGPWQLRAALNQDMTARMQFPSSWAGLEGSALAKASGQADAIFCHRNCHLAGAHSRAGVLQLASLAISANGPELLAA